MQEKLLPLFKEAPPVNTGLLDFFNGLSDADREAFGRRDRLLEQLSELPA